MTSAIPSSRSSRVVFTIASAVVIMAGLRAASDIVVPVLLAMFLAFVSSPLVFRLSRGRMPYQVAVSLVLLLQVLVLSTLGLLVARSAAALEERLPMLRTRLGEVQDELVRWLSRHVGLRASEVAGLFDTGLLVESFGDAALRAGALLGSAFLVILVLAFTLFDASRLWRLLDEHFTRRHATEVGPEGSADLDEEETHMVSRVSVEVNRYLTIKTTISITTGLLLGVYCYALDVDFPVLWGLLAFLLNYVPNIGSIVAAGPPIVLAWLMQGTTTALLVVVGYGLVNLVLGNILEPKLMGTALGMSPVVVLLSIVIWGFLLGPVGALLSAPLTMIVKIALANTREWAWVAELMSNPRRQGQRPIPARADHAPPHEAPST